MAKVTREPSDSLFPLPAMLVTCADSRGNTNVITLAWVSKVCADPPMICAAIRSVRHSYSMIKESGEFVVNVPTERIVRQVDLCGHISGRNTDKFAEAKLTMEPAKKVKAPIIKECVANFECVVRHSLRLGTHDLFVGEVVAVQYDDSILKPDGKVDYRKAKPIVYAAPEYWSLGEQVGTYGYSVRK